MTWGQWIALILIVIGTSVGTCCIMEAYFNRRAMEQVGEHDAPEQEVGRHAATPGR